MTGDEEARGADPTDPLPGCYTTARVRAGRVERLERHARRLRRDAERLGMPLPVLRTVETELAALARSTFPDGEGIVRAEWSSLRNGPPRLRLNARPLDTLPPAWRAIRSDATHPGPGQRLGTKHTDVTAWVQARREIVPGAIEESLLFDAEGRLVEGSRTNLVLVLPGDRLFTPAAFLGGVEGLGLECVREGAWRIEEGEIDDRTLETASAVLAVNVVRGIVPIVELDGHPLGPAGPVWARRLGGCFGASLRRGSP
jgi:branched-subunit amino acid aminotransferase/4-amino-4-deoxychorismate lyase